MDIHLHPIGYVHNGVQTPRPDGWAAIGSRIELLAEYAPGLLALDGFSHVTVVCWLHLVPPDLRTVTQDPVAPGRPPAGTFATRSQRRPNPLGVSVVHLVKVAGATVTVRGLDAIDGTPVLDLRPYLPPFDAPANARMPRWVW